jgi:phospholipid/cholesterol/gamma-HCH transport system ATP-binding protein
MEQNEILRIEKLCKSFNHVEILKDIDLSLHTGENLVVMGKSGIGKTVLIKCIVRLIEPDAGKILVFGEDIADDLHLNEIRRKVGFLFQGGALYDSMSVRENLEFPLTRTRLMHDRKKIRELVMEVLENVGLADTLNRMPSELSGGMKKRIGLARTLILKPRILLYDEPTTGLDQITAREISELMVDIQKKYNSASIVITHDVNCAQITGGEVVILQDAHFIARGTFEELKNHQDAKIREYF